MKKLGELISEINYEAGAQGAHEFDVYIEKTILDVLDELTSSTRFPDLYIVNQTVTLTTSQATFDLPADFQFLDWRSVRYRPGGNAAQDRTLQQQGANLTAVNTGATTYFSFTAKADGSGWTITLWPNSAVVNADQIVYNYWRKASSILTTLNAFIIPDIVIPHLRLKVLARVCMQTGTAKQNLDPFVMMSKEARASWHAALELPESND